MITIAVAEDDPVQRRMLCGYTRSFFKHNHEEVKLLEFENGRELVARYPAGVDLILMDIDMPLLNGLDAARRIREREADTLLIFITKLIQCALEGYAVDAMDFVVKPVNEVNLGLALKRALKRIRQRRGHHIKVQCKKESVVVNINQITYAETNGRYVRIHLKQGILDTSETMQRMEAMTKGYPFFRCHNSFLVNLEAVDNMGNTEVCVAGDLIPVSKYRKADFLNTMINYMGGIR